MLWLPNVVDHIGNAIDSVSVANAVVAAGFIVEHFVPDDKKRPFFVATATVAAATSIAVNSAYEAGVKIPTIPQKTEDNPFDTPDVVYGGAAGILFSTVYCVSALTLRRRFKRLDRERNERNAADGGIA